MIARYPGICNACRGSIVEGQKIEKVKDRVYKHADCSDLEVQQDAFKVKNPDDPATEKQVALINRLRLERVVPDDVVLASDHKYTRGEASHVIDRLMDAPKASRAPLPGPDVVPAGRYALTLNLYGEDHVVLVRVWRGSQNPSVVRCYDDDSGAAVDRADTLRRIVESGPADAARLYGKLRQKCSRCNRNLENRLSVELSIGPDCLKHWYSEDQCVFIRDDARAKIRARGEDPYDTVRSTQEPEQMEMIGR